MKLSYMNIASVQADNVHSRAKKRHLIYHETVSPDQPGWSDILANSDYLDRMDYGIHGLTDAEGHLAWAYGLGNAVFWQAGGMNTTGIGIENVSRVMLQSPSNVVRRAIWAARTKQLQGLAKLSAAVCRAQDIPIKAAVWDHAHQRFTDGILSHYQVSQHYPTSKGHTDCWPVHLGGYFPMYQVIYMAKGYYAAGYHL